MELADVLDSKSSGSDTVRVRPPLPAPTEKGRPTGRPFSVGATKSGSCPQRGQRGVCREAFLYLNLYNKKLLAKFKKGLDIGSLNVL